MNEIKFILDSFYQSNTKLKNIEIFLFGSVRRRRQTQSDIDLLVIYESAEDLAKVKNILKCLDLQWPVDVLYMLSCEEEELNFIESEHCLRIFPQ